MKIHITKQGESIDTIANTYSVSRQDLTGINPHVNLASDLVPGLKLKIPDASRAEKNEHIEKFYPNLNHEKHLKEHAVPIGAKPLKEEHSHVHDHHTPAEATHPTHPPHPHAEVSHHPHLPHHAHHHEATHPAPHHEAPWSHLGEHTTHLNPEMMHHYPWNHPFPPFSAPDTRALIPPVPFYPPYPYPPYGYPPYGYGYPLPIPGFGPGYGFGHGWHGHGGGHFGGGHGGGHHR